MKNNNMNNIQYKKLNNVVEGTLPTISIMTGLFTSATFDFSLGVL